MINLVGQLDMALGKEGKTLECKQQNKNETSTSFCSFCLYLSTVSACLIFRTSLQLIWNAPTSTPAWWSRGANLCSTENCGVSSIDVIEGSAAFTIWIGPRQTWDLSKILHRRIFRPKILHRQLHLISTFWVIKTQKMSENWEIYAAGKNISLLPAVTA